MRAFEFVRIENSEFEIQNSNWYSRENTRVPGYLEFSKHVPHPT